MTTEAEALENILVWSADSPGWQRDALRRLATLAALEPAEIDELAAICKGNSPPVPLEAGHLRGQTANRGKSICGRCMESGTSMLSLPTKG